MIEINECYWCCGLEELGGFPFDKNKTFTSGDGWNGIVNKLPNTVKNLAKEIRKEIRQNSGTKAIIATTNQHQKIAAKALQAIGFERIRKFKGVYYRLNTITLWFKRVKR